MPTIEPGMIDPNIVYLVLIFGLWIGVTATYVPGTGLLELLAVLALIGSLIILSSMPTNWVAVMIIVLGVLTFIVMPFIKQQFVLLSVGGLALQAGGALFMFGEGYMVHPVVIVMTIGLALIYYRFGLIPILERVRKQAAMGVEDTLLGAKGKVVKALNPTGTVNVRGELWTASSDKPLDPGDEIIVVERDGLQIIVEGLKHKRRPNNTDLEESTA